ncbi:MAG TPA: class I SAM-dependent methyltransferase [Stellaceae bacterium]|nr:class I SAM-dependent methyltransferase [Stellaceae bacterium]
MSDPPTDSPADRSAEWHAYYVATEGRPPRRTVLFALDLFGAAGPAMHAADLGCGDGRDTIELLRRDWSVIAIDAAPEAIARLRRRADLPHAARLDARCGKFEDENWGRVELVNASFALPLCPPHVFPALWRKIGASLSAGGRFAGQLYGPRDSWAQPRPKRQALTIFDAAAVRALFADYTIELLEEEESAGVTLRGTSKHWHIFHICARKN